MIPDQERFDALEELVFAQDKTIDKLIEMQQQQIAIAKKISETMKEIARDIAVVIRHVDDDDDEPYRRG